MKADKLTLEKMFDRTERLEAPLFQRPYVWKRDANWVPLWDAIQAVAVRRLEAKQFRPHFLGTVVLDQMKTATGRLHVRQIIDGQQRLTTLQLLLAALRDICQEADQPQFAAAFKKLTDNYVPLSDSKTDTLKVWPTNADREDFQSVMWAGSSESVRAMPHSDPEDEYLIPDAYLFFADQLKSWLLQSEGLFAQRLECLYATVREDIHLVVIDLEESDNAQEIFETLNALGTPLLPADLVKNYLFRRAEAQGLSSGQLYEIYWKDFDSLKSYWRSETRQGRLKRPRLDHFLTHYLVLMTGEDVISSQLFSDFKAFVDSSDSRPAEDHMRTFKSYADVFRTFDSFDEGTREGLFFWRMEQLDTTAALPLLLEIFQRYVNGGSRNDLVQILTDLESWIVRRAVCEMSNKSYTRLFADAIKALRSTNDFSPEAIRTWLLSQTNDSSIWPDDKTFEEAWRTLKFYKRLKKTKTRMILEALNASMKTKKTEDVRIEHYLTIEHLLPREWEKHWPLSIPQDDLLKWNEARERREDVLHTIGNLTLLTKSLNPSVSNGPWAKKREQILKHSALNLNRVFSDSSDWDEKAIERRAKELFGQAMKIWPHPGSRP